MRKKLLLAGFLLLLLGAVLLGAGVLGGWFSGERQPPAPDAPEAKKWGSPKPGPVGNHAPPQKPVPEELFEKEPGPQIVLENVPQVPERLLGPSPPIEESS